MEISQLLKDKRVIYGGGAALALVIVFVFIRAKTPAPEASEDGNSDTGSLYFPVDFSSSIGAGNAATQTSDPTSMMVDLAKTQVKSQTQLGIGAIGSDFMNQLIDKFKTLGTSAGKFQGVEGTFGFDEGGMLDFDFSYKNIMTTPSQPRQNVTVPRVALVDNSGNRPGNK